MRKDAFFQRGIEMIEGKALCRWAVTRDDSDLIEVLKYVIRNNRRSFLPYTLTEPPTDRVYPWGRVALPIAMLGGRLFDERAAGPIPSAAFTWEGIDTDTVSMVIEHHPTALTMLVHNFKDRPVHAAFRAIQLPEGRYRLATAPDANGDRRPDTDTEIREIMLRRFTPTRLELPPKSTLHVDLQLLEARPRRPRPDLAVTLAQPADDRGAVIARVHNLGCAPVDTVGVDLILDGQSVAREAVGHLPGLSGYEPQFRDVTLRVPDGVAPGACELVVDRDEIVDEINESNNAFPIRLGVPPTIEGGPEIPLG